MPRLEWNKTGENRYEDGLDRGTLFVPGSPGVVWNGLKSIQEGVSGGELLSIHYDGLKTNEILSGEDFTATIEAYSAPLEFAPCEGDVALAAGLFATAQVRSRFGLAYRTGLGDNAVLSDRGYKIHIVYGLTASPSSPNYETRGSDVNPMSKQWKVDAVPPYVLGQTYRPTAHLVVDSTRATPARLTALENLLWGSSTQTSSLPTQAQVISTLAGT